MSVAAATGTAPAVLVVDDDRRVVDLLTIALTAHGYRVLQAADGEEALKVAVRERPDLVVLDVRLPKRSGFEVCEQLRQDPDDPGVPIIMVSAAAETESRLQGLARGADDYVVKPFSPKELIARIKRLLARSIESRDIRRRTARTERELVGAREDVRRSHGELREARRLREVASGLQRELADPMDLERLAGKLLTAAQDHLGGGPAVLFAAEDGQQTLEVLAVRALEAERFAALRVPRDGELATLVFGLGRPFRLHELDHLGVAGEAAALRAAGASLLGPLRAGGLDALLAIGEPRDGRDFTAADRSVLAALCETAAPALLHAWRGRRQAEGWIETLVALAGAREPAFATTATEWQARVRGLVGLSRFDILLAAQALQLARWAESEEGRCALRSAVERDPSGWCARVSHALERRQDNPAAQATSVEGRVSSLVAAGRAYIQAREAGRSTSEAVGDALRVPGLDPAWHTALAADGVAF